MKRLDILILGFVLVFGLLLRLYKINSPIADWHSYRQTDTAAVARNFHFDGFNLLYPQSDSVLPLSADQTPNPNRYFMNEFPLYTALVAVVYNIFGYSDVYARLMTVFISLFSIAGIYLLARQLFGSVVAAVAALWYAVVPFSVYYGRTVLPDQLFVALSIFSVYFFWRYLTRTNVFNLCIFTAVFAFALLAKPYAVFLSILFALAVLDKFRFKLLSYVPVILSLLVASIPFLAWRYHISLYPEASFATDWLFNGTGIRFTGAFFRWLIFERINNLIFGGTGFVVFGLGITLLFSSRAHRYVLYYLLSLVTYLVVFAQGNVTHDYYQIPLLPMLSLVFSLGAIEFVRIGTTTVNRYINLVILIFLIGFSLAFAWYQVRDFYRINQPTLVTAGEHISQLTTPHDLVIAPYNTDPTLLYHTGRHGWTTGFDIESKIAQGADYYLSLNNDTETAELSELFQVIEKNDSYTIIKLVPKLL